MFDPQLVRWGGDPTVQALMVRGAGERAFCAGGDVTNLYRESRENPSGTLRRDFPQRLFQAKRRIQIYTDKTQDYHHHWCSTYQRFVVVHESAAPGIDAQICGVPGYLPWLHRRLRGLAHVAVLGKEPCIPGDCRHAIE